MFEQFVGQAFNAVFEPYGFELAPQLPDERFLSVAADAVYATPYGDFAARIPSWVPHLDLDATAQVEIWIEVELYGPEASVVVSVGGCHPAELIARWGPPVPPEGGGDTDFARQVEIGERKLIGLLKLHQGLRPGWRDLFSPSPNVQMRSTGDS